MANPVVTSLPAYVEQQRPLVVASSVLGAKTLDYIQTQPDVKGPTAINVLTSTVEFQDGASCGFTNKGTSTLSQRVINAKAVKANKEYCAKQLVGKYAQSQLNIRAGQENLPFEREFMAAESEAIAATIDKVIWQGNTLDSDENLKRFDGFIKIFEGDGAVIDVAIENATPKIDAVKAVLAKVPASELREGLRVFCSPAFAQAYNMELVEKNWYHFEPGMDANETRIPGSVAILTSVGGLAGIEAKKEGKGYLVASQGDNLVYGTDANTLAEDDVKLWYSDDADAFRFKCEFIAGVQTAFPDKVVLGTIAAL